MARVYPKQLPKHVLENPKLSSEVRVYERIRDKVPGDFTCYYSRSWHEADDHGAEFDGEADFIVAHATRGSDDASFVFGTVQFFPEVHGRNVHLRRMRRLRSLRLATIWKLSTSGYCAA